MRSERFVYLDPSMELEHVRYGFEADESLRQSCSFKGRLYCFGNFFGHSIGIISKPILAFVGAISMTAALPFILVGVACLSSPDFCDYVKWCGCKIAKGLATTAISPFTQALLAIRALAGAIFHPRAYFRPAKDLQDRLIFSSGNIDVDVRIALNVAFAEASIRPDIKKIFIMGTNNSQSYLPFEFEGPFHNEFKKLFTIQNEKDGNERKGKAVLTEGGKALLIVLCCEEADFHLAHGDRNLIGMRAVQLQLQQFANGGNIALAIPRRQEQFHTHLLWEVPPAIRSLLSSGKAS